MRILLPRKMSQYCLLSYSTHAMSASGLGDLKDPCEVTRSRLMDIARRLRFHVLSASPPSFYARVHIKRQSCSRSKSCNTRSIFYSTLPEQPRPKYVCAPVVSSTAPIVYGAVSHGRPAEIRQETEESSTISVEQRLKDLEIVPNYHDIAVRSLEAWSTTAFLWTQTQNQHRY